MIIIINQTPIATHVARSVRALSRYYVTMWARAIDGTLHKYIWLDPGHKEGWAATVTPTLQQLEETELNGADLSQHEPDFRFFRLGKPPTHHSLVAPSIIMLPATITAVEHPGTDPPAENFILVEDRAMPTPDDPGDLANDNLVDLTSLVELPGTDPPDNTFFPDRLSAQIEFWMSINAPAYIIKQLEERVDVGLTPA